MNPKRVNLDINISVIQECRVLSVQSGTLLIILSLRLLNTNFIVVKVLVSVERAAGVLMCKHFMETFNTL